MMVTAKNETERFGGSSFPFLRTVRYGRETVELNAVPLEPPGGREPPVGDVGG